MRPSSAAIASNVVIVSSYASRAGESLLCRTAVWLRQDAGLTQHAVAAHLGIAQQTLAHYEVGRLRLPVALVPKLADLFDVPTDVLLGVISAHASKASG